MRRDALGRRARGEVEREGRVPLAAQRQLTAADRTDIDGAECSKKPRCVQSHVGAWNAALERDARGLQARAAVIDGRDDERAAQVPAGRFDEMGHDDSR